MNDHGQRYASQVSTASETFAANRAAQLALVGRLQALLDRAEQLSAAARPRFEKRGQLLPRERL
ncbi:MAG TPA: acetyl-CoA carboxylase carboxyltransferase subunit, partial [Halieaceae bacterium]|nr:acetyl-CoA carboxylase carboxyltransferase subunit [Halieaceae bacterium]